MRIIHVGMKGRGRDWLEGVRDYAGSASVAGVDPDVSAWNWAKSHFPPLDNYCYATLKEGLENIQADAAIIAGPLPSLATLAIEALEAGLAVLMERSPSESFSETARIVDVSTRTGRPVLIVQNGRFSRCERVLQTMLREGKVGSITHVSCEDRLATPDTGALDSNTDYSQLLNVGARDFESLRNIIGKNPVTVMARCIKASGSQKGQGARTEAFLEVGDNIHIQYYGSLNSYKNEYALWIEGEKGVLWSDRCRIWWRKRGWRFFLPIKKVSPLKEGEISYSKEVKDSIMKNLQEAVLHGRKTDTGGEIYLQTLAMVEAAQRSFKEERIVKISEILKEVSS